MSDQTDIERIIENQLSDLTLPCDMRDIRIRMAGAVQQCLAGKDAEIARLKNAHESELEKGEARFVEMAESLESTREVLEEVNSHNEKTQEENLELAAEVIQLRARLAEATKTRDEYGALVDKDTALVLALEAQCHRMRDALTQVKHGAEYTDELGDIIDDALSAPLALELLNRVRSFVSDVAACEPEHYGDDCTCITCGAKRLLKSLSPAP